MCDQLSILRALVAAKEPMTIDALVAAKLCGEGGHVHARAQRHQIIKTLGKLGQRNFARRINPLARGNFHEHDPALYEATDAGRAHVKSGAPLPVPPRTSGVKRTSELRERLWRALRQMPGKRGTLPEVVELVIKPGEKFDRLLDQAHKYFLPLVRAGVLVQLGQRAGGNALTSNGFVRYALIRDLGAAAPVSGAKRVFDPNTNEQLPFIKKPALPSRKKGRA